ncbi:MAG: hypothetical protein HWN68_10225 [Desulfobacterales bacterium]|nr:hypothetical protein [Desulfobacterales bacterium]
MGFLDPVDERYLAPKICAVLLAGHDVKDYPAIMGNRPMPPKLVKSATKLINVLSEEATECGIDTFHIDMFLVPFPNIQAFRNALLKELGRK